MRLVDKAKKYLTTLQIHSDGTGSYKDKDGMFKKLKYSARRLVAWHERAVSCCQGQKFRPG